MIPTRRTALLRRALAGSVPIAACAVLAACAPTISVPVAQDATDPVCADVVLDTPDQLVSLHRVRSSSQATTAWGTTGAAITLRCGVAKPAPSDQCVSIESPDGSTVDWIGTEDSSGWTFVTYGRSPAVEVRVPKTAKVTQATAPLVDLAPAVQDVKATAHCS